VIVNGEKIGGVALLKEKSFYRGEFIPYQEAFTYISKKAWAFDGKSMPQSLKDQVRNMVRQMIQDGLMDEEGVVLKYHKMNYQEEFLRHYSLPLQVFQ